MTNAVLNILIALSTLIIAILAFADEIARIPDLTFFKKLWFKIVVVLLATILGVWSTIAKEKLSDQEKFESEKRYQQENIRKDSLNKIAVEENSRRMMVTFTSVLATYGLKYDAAQQKLLDENKMLKNLQTQIIEDYTGGSSYCYINLEIDNKRTPIFTVVHRGKKILKNIEIEINDVARYNILSREMGKEMMSRSVANEVAKKTRYKHTIPILYPGKLDETLTIPREVDQFNIDLIITISLANGQYKETISCENLRGPRIGTLKISKGELTLIEKKEF